MVSDRTTHLGVNLAFRLQLGCRRGKRIAVAVARIARDSLLRREAGRLVSELLTRFLLLDLCTFLVSRDLAVRSAADLPWRGHEVLACYQLRRAAHCVRLS